MSGLRFRLLLAGVAACVTALTALGIGVRATYGAHTTADEPQYLLSALSLWEDGSLDISDELEAERYRDFHELALPAQTRPLADGRHISPHNPLLPALVALPMGLWGWTGVKAFLAVLAGGLAALMVWVGHRRFHIRPGVAVAAAAIFSLAPPLAIYATQVYPELPAALVVTAAIAVLTGRPGTAPAVVAVAAVVVLPWLSVKYVPVAAVLAVATLMWLPRRRRRQAVGWLAAAGVGYLAVHWAIYGGFTPYAAGDHFVGGEFTVVGTEPQLWGRATRLVGLLVDRGFGLAAWQPAYLLLPLAATYLLRQRLPGSGLLVGLVGTGWLVAGFAALTMHGWWFPGRQLVVVLPAAVLLVARWADTSGLSAAATTGLGLLGVGAFGFLLVEGLSGDLTWVVDFGSTGYPPYRLYSSLLPDYMDLSVATWLRHGIWSVVLVGLLVIGRQTGMGASGWRDRVMIERERHAT